MPISEAQLETWSHQGAVTSSARAYEAVNSAIGASQRLARWTVTVYLQGSYRNHTNTRADSDVDVVVHCSNTFFYDTSWLDPARKQAVESAIQPPVYTWPQFKSDVLAALSDHFGQAVKPGNKCITVANPGGTQLHADVVPAFDHRLYWVRNEQTIYEEGIGIRTEREPRVIRNYPKRHYDKGVAKNSITNDWFKPTARVFKNVRARLVELGRLNEDDFPSYFIECLVYNAGHLSFIANSWQQRFAQVYSSLSNGELAKFKCVNEVKDLFDGTPDGWNQDQARLFMAQVAQLWSES